MLNHVMIDIETLGTQPGSVILSIGACYFGLPEGTPEASTFYTNISIDSCLKHGLTVMGDTIYWWLKQPKEAQEALFDPRPLGLAEALSAFRRWLPQDSAKFYVWSYGSDFDLTLLAVAYSRLGQMPPWRYKHVRDARTIYWLAPGHEQAVPQERPGESQSVKHHALNDAVRQALRVQAAYRLLFKEAPIGQDVHA